MTPIYIKLLFIARMRIDEKLTEEKSEKWPKYLFLMSQFCPVTLSFWGLYFNNFQALSSDSNEY